MILAFDICGSNEKNTMGLEKILAISGKPGLYELTAQSRGGFIVRSIPEGKKMSVSIRHNVSLLSEIAVYTYTEEVPLARIFEKIREKEEGGEAISHKASKAEIETYFAEVLPDYDVDRVYASDMKKIIQWYNLLVQNGITDFTDEKEKEEQQQQEEEQQQQEKEEENEDIKKEV